MAGGMARRGALPVVHSFACFLAARPNEQIYNQCSERSKVVYVASLAGLLPGGPGHSHQSVRDISALAAVPGLRDGGADRRGRSGAAPRRAAWTSRRQRVPASGVGEMADAVHLSARPPRGGGAGLDGSRGRRRRHVRLRPVDAVERVARGRRSCERARAARAVVVLPWLNRVDAAWLREPIGDGAPSSRWTTTTCTAARARCWRRRSPGWPSTRRVRCPLGVTALPECGTNDEVLQHHGLDVAGLVPRSSGACAGARRRAATDRMTVLFWDIDGTLLTTAKGGMFAWDDAVKEITGREFQLQSMRIPGMTDYQIAARTFEMLGLDADERAARGWCAATRNCCPRACRAYRSRAAERARGARAPARTRPTCGRTC